MIVTLGLGSDWDLALRGLQWREPSCFVDAAIEDPFMLVFGRPALNAFDAAMLGLLLVDLNIPPDEFDSVSFDDWVSRLRDVSHLAELCELVKSMSDKRRFDDAHTTLHL